MRQLPRLAWRDHERVERTDLVEAAIIEHRRAIEDETEDQLAVLAAERERVAAARAQRSDLGEAAAGDADVGQLGKPPVGRAPRRIGCDMAQEILPAVDSPGLLPLGSLRLWSA